MFRAGGMSSDVCALRIEAALLAVSGVNRARVDFATREVDIDCERDVSPSDLAAAASYAGYTLRFMGDSGHTHAMQGKDPEDEDPDTDDSSPEGEGMPILDDDSSVERPYESEPKPEDEPQPEDEPKESEPAPPPPEEPERTISDLFAFEPGEQPAPEAERGKGWGPIRFVAHAAMWCVAVSLVWALAYRIVPVPVTMLMLGDAFSGEGVRNQWVPLERISPNLVRAVIASEDDGFCNHYGFDFDALQSAWETVQAGGRARGASTISQQTAKNSFLWADRSWLRKGLEAYFTVVIEALWPKRRIMEVYLNIAEWGKGIYGAEAAARHWFKKSAAKLTPMEAARLAAILPSPRRWRANPAGPYVTSRAYTIMARAGGVDWRCARR